MKLSQKQIEGIHRLCQSFHVDKMYLFGSALEDGFNQESDYDFLVRFKPIDLSSYFDNYVSFRAEPRSLLGRDIDLVEEQTLKYLILIESIDNSKELVYG